MKRYSLCGTLLLLVLVMARGHASPEIPGAPQDHPIALVGGKVFPVTGAAIDDATILFDKGKIVAIGVDIALPEKTERIDVRGKHIYPGLIDANTQLGLLEIPSVRGSLDHTETGTVNPNVRAEVAFNPDSELIPTTRSAGVLTVLTMPNGGLVSGMACCMTLDGWTWEDMCLKGGMGLCVNWPNANPIEVRASELPEGAVPEGRGGGALSRLKQALVDTRNYRTALQAWKDGKGPEPDHDLRWDAMLPIVEGQMPVFVHADDCQQIQAAIAFCVAEGLKPIIVGGYDAAECAPLLKLHNVPVIVAGTYRLPRRRGDAYDAAYTLPERLRQAGVTYCIASPTGAPQTNVRNVAHHAGSAVAYGLSADEALKSVTLYPAQILGVADRIGSLEVGKDATLIVTTGDALEIPTQVTAAYIQGRVVSLNDRHKRLWEKYKEKYRRIGIEN